MPKAPSSVRLEASTPLRRNQACHQCRRKKMKCDAKRPVCTPCTKAYAHSIAALAVQGQPFQVPCSYDGSSDSLDLSDSSRSKSMEPPIITSQRQSPPAGTSGSYSSDKFTLRNSAWETSSQDSVKSGAQYGDSGASTTSSFDTYPTQSMSSGTAYPEQASLDEFLGLLPLPSSLPLGPGHGSVYGSPSASRTESPEPGFYLTPPSQVSDGPNCELPSTIGLLQLVHMFFDQVPFATILLHRSRFITFLLDGPLLATYPSVALLHAICAVTAVYLLLGPSPKQLGQSVSRRHIDCAELNKDPENNLQFASAHAKAARHWADHEAQTGSGSLDAARTYVILGWYHYLNASWSDWWIVTGAAARLAVPLGLNVSAFFNRDNPLDFDPIMPPTQSPQDAERNRALFWLSFINERHQQMSTQWAGCLDEADIGQELPVPLRYLESGDVPRGYRQRLCDPDLFTNHPDNLTDPFILHLKAIILVARIGSFNTRTRIRQHSDRNHWVVGLSSNSSDIIASEAFQNLDSSITAFVESIPQELRGAYSSTVSICTHGQAQCPTCGDPNPRFAGATSVGHLYELNILPHIATIMLHEAHIDMGASHDASREKVLYAARSILDSIYTLMSKSLDVSLLPGYALSHWMSTGRILGRFYVRALELGHNEEAPVIRTEIEVLNQLMRRLGERIPVAARSQKALGDIIHKAHAFVDDRRNGMTDQPERHLFGKYGLF